MPIRILVVSDGIPGHENQSKGLRDWLTEYIDCEIVLAQVKLRAKAVSRLLLPFLASTRLPERLLFRLFYVHGCRFDLFAQSFDVIISMGGNTSFANILLSRVFNARNVFIGSLRRLNPQHFVVHLSLEQQPHANHLRLPFAPSRVNARELSEQANKFLAEKRLDDECYCALLIGGDGAGFTYHADDWQALAKWANNYAATHNIRWLISTSRRSGVQAERTLVKNLNDEYIADAVFWQRSQENIVTAYMGVASRIFVTGDSMSMINEAIASEKPCVALLPPHNAADQRYIAALRRFEAEGMCEIRPLTPFSMTENEPATFSSASEAIAQKKAAFVKALITQLELSA